VALVVAVNPTGPDLFNRPHPLTRRPVTLTMPRHFLALTFLALAAILPATLMTAAPADTRVFELRTYTTPPGKLPNLLARFRDHTCALFEKPGMTNVAYWVPADEKDGSADKLVYLLAYPSREAAKASWAAFMADPEWKAVREASEVDGKIVAKVESIFLAPTDYSPAIPSSSKSPSRVFELRTYTTPDNKLAALDARFGGGETDLFKKAGMQEFGYFHPLDADKGAANTLIYIMAHESREAAAKSWQSFRDDPVWVKMKADTEVDGPLASKVVSVFLHPTDFSATK